MSARTIMAAQPGDKVGLGNGLRLVCDKRNGSRYFELRKRIRGKDYSWGVGSVDAVTMEGCNKALSAARQQADKILEARLVKRWMDQGMPAKEARERAQMNDLVNARRVVDRALPATWSMSQ